MAKKLKFDAEGKGGKGNVLDTREIYPGVRVKVADSRAFIHDMMSMDNPIWRWVVRIGVIIIMCTNLYIMVKVM